MRVLLTSTSYPSDLQDWRGRFISDMVCALANQNGLDLEVWAPPGELPQCARYFATENEAVWLGQMMQHGGIMQLVRKRGPFALHKVWRLLTHLRAAYRRSPADILHINWLQNALPLNACRKPALVTVLGSDLALLKLPGMVTMLRRVFRGRRVILAPNADWMVSKLVHYFGDQVEVRTIPFGIDLAWFNVKRVVDPALPLNWLAVTRLTPGKLGSLFEWGQDVFGDRHILHLFGPRQDADIVVPDWVRYHGSTHPAALREEWFPKAAGLITLSRHDEGRPQVMLEAMAAGLPVIASMLPAHREIIQNGRTGVLVDRPEELRAALDYLADSSSNDNMGMAARAWVRDEIGTWDDCAARYVAAYRDLLEGR